MSYKKELLNMSRRLDQVQLKENPPELKMVVADENKGNHYQKWKIGILGVYI